MEFSSVWGPVSSPRIATITSPLRPTTLAETRYPCEAQVWIAVCAMVTAIGSDRSLLATSCALAELASMQASPEASESAVRQDVVLIMSMSSFEIRWCLRLSQLFCDLVDAGLGASLVLVAARRTRNPDGADRLFADLDRERALCRRDVGQEQGSRIGIALDVIRKLA